MKLSKHIFISFKTEERDYAYTLKETLEKANFKVWWQEDLQCGHEWHSSIDKAIDSAAAIVVLWSAKSQTSPWVRHEASQAMAMDIYAPVRIESLNIDSPYDRIQATDIHNLKGDPAHPGVQILLARLKELIPPEIFPAEKVINFVYKNRAAIISLLIAALAFWLLIKQNSIATKQTADLKNITLNLHQQNDGLSAQMDSINRIIVNLNAQEKQSKEQLRKQEEMLENLAKQKKVSDTQLKMQKNALKGISEASETINLLKYPLDSLNFSMLITDSLSSETQKKLLVIIQIADVEDKKLKSILLKDKALTSAEQGLKDEFLGGLSTNVAINSIILNNSEGEFDTITIGGRRPLVRFYSSNVLNESIITLKLNNLLDFEEKIIVVHVTDRSIESALDSTPGGFINLSVAMLAFPVSGNQNSLFFLPHKYKYNNIVYYIGTIHKGSLKGTFE